MQQLLRLSNQGCGEAGKIAQAKEVLQALPPGNWYRRAGDLYNDNDTDAGIFDSLLHSQDRAYTVEEIHAWLGDTHGFTIELSDVGRGRYPYLPELTLGLEARRLRARLPALRRTATPTTSPSTSTSRSTRAAWNRCSRRRTASRPCCATRTSA